MPLDSRNAPWTCPTCRTEVVSPRVPPEAWFWLSMAKKGSKAPPQSPGLGVFCSKDCLAVSLLKWGCGLSKRDIRDWLDGRT
jgi:hypothetical protein